MHKPYLEMFAQRRASIAAQMPPRSVYILPGTHPSWAGLSHPEGFQTDRFFYYVTGFEEPDAWAFLHKQDDKTAFILCNTPADPDRVRWEGPIAGQNGAIADYGATHSVPTTECFSQLVEILGQCDVMYYEWGVYAEADQLVSRALQHIKKNNRLGHYPPPICHSAHHALGERRLFKDQTEQQHIQKAVDISVHAHEEALRFIQPGQWEYQVEAVIRHAFHQAGARHAAYPPIVGAGPHACYLHYTQHQGILQAGDLILIDAGCQWQGYAADITRTWPISGRFTLPQRQVYAAVLKAQYAGIAAIQPGAPWGAIQDAILASLVPDLIALGILSGDPAEIIASGHYRQVYMHSSGHWLGLNVHDVGRYKTDPNHWRPLEPGMVLTVEPGVYLAADLPIDPQWHGIGIRIEDDILVTETGHTVLSTALPKTIEAIEAWMNPSRPR